jgi:hypothetical protein
VTGSMSVIILSVLAALVVSRPTPAAPYV